MPDFLVIGGMKCGTTSLDFYLKAHPQIAMPTKELDYFSRKYHLGVDWYESKFIKKGKKIRILGETSVSYAKYPYHKDVAKRIYSVLPEAKLIYVIRDPIDRIISHYMHMVYADSEDRPFEKVFEEEGMESLYVYYSRYYLQIEKYLEFFNKDKIFLICSEDLGRMESRMSILKKVFLFLDVHVDVESSRFYDARQRTAQKGKKNKAARIISTLPLYRFMVANSPVFFRDFYIRYFTKKLERPAIPDYLRNQFIKVLKPDIDNLRHLYGHRFDSWSL